MPVEWNHNLHYDPVILNAVPAGCRRALDVGCGDGRLVRRLANRCVEVTPPAAVVAGSPEPDVSITGIDRDAPMIKLARERSLSGGGLSSHGRIALTFLLEDFLTYSFKEESFDFVCANTSLHHMDFAAALRRLAWVLRPGGRLAVIGIARDASPTDWVIGAAGIPSDRLHKIRHGYRATRRGSGDPRPPVRDPGMSWPETRKTAREILPGARYRRLLLWRYSLLWDKPTELLSRRQESWRRCPSGALYRRSWATGAKRDGADGPPAPSARWRGELRG